MNKGLKPYTKQLTYQIGPVSASVNIDETVKTVDFGSSLLYTLDSTVQSAFDIFPLNNSLISLNGTKPIASNLRNSRLSDKDRAFNFNNQIKRYAYAADS